MDSQLTASGAAKSLEWAKEITVAAVQASDGKVYPCANDGKDVAGFFKAVYMQIAEIAKEQNL